MSLQEGGEGLRVEPGPGPELDGRHDPVTHHGVGHGVDGGQEHVGVAGQDALDRGGREVLPVDPQPLEVPAREVEEPGVVPIGEVARPVHAVPHPGRRGVVVVPVALEPGSSQLVDQLADGLARVQQPPLVVEAGRRALQPRVGVEHDRSLGGHAQGAGRSGGRAQHRGPALGRAVVVDHGAAEAAGEAVDVGLHRLVAEHETQRVLGVVGPLGRGQDVREGLAHVVEVGDAEAAHVG